MSANGSLQKFDLDKDLFRSLNAHQAFEKTLVRINIDQPLVDSHFPTIPSVSALATRALSGRDPEAFCRERDWPTQFHTSAFGDLHDLAAYAVQALGVSA